MFDVTNSRQAIFETRNPDELWDVAVENESDYEAEVKVEHPAYQLRLVIEFHPKTKMWVLYSEKVLKSEFGGPLQQEQTIDQLQAMQKVSERHAAEGGDKL